MGVWSGCVWDVGDGEEDVWVQSYCPCVEGLRDYLEEERNVNVKGR